MEWIQAPWTKSATTWLHCQSQSRCDSSGDVTAVLPRWEDFKRQHWYLLTEFPFWGKLTVKDPPESTPTWWWQWCCRSRCKGSWCSQRAREPGASAASRDRTCSWTPCYWSPKYLSAPAAEEARCLRREKGGERLMYRYWTGREKNEQINRDRQTGSEESSRVNMLEISKMPLKATVQVHVHEVLDMERGAASGCECRCVFTHNPLEQSKWIHFYY